MSEKDFLKAIRPKKSLGQNFLVDKNIINKIIETINIAKKDIVLEIGPGSGALTSQLLDKAKFVSAVEIDSRFCKVLKERFKKKKNLEILNKDILELDFSSLKQLARNKLKVIGNIPYYISSSIIEYLIENRRFIDEICITVQKEFAEKILASAGSKGYGILSCLAQFYTEAAKLFTINKDSFLPGPKVDSVFLRLNVLEDPRFRVQSEVLLFKIIHASFSQRRKTILNSLSRIVPKVKLEGLLNKLKIDCGLRPENISLKDFVSICNTIDSFILIKA